MNIHYFRLLITVILAMSFSQTSAQADDTTDAVNVRHISGEIMQVDVKLGTLQFKNHPSEGREEVKDYRINKNDTRVTDPLDVKFLTIDDLQAGQYIVIDVVHGEENKVIKKIIAEPYLAPGLQQAFGSIQSVDIPGGMLTLEERPLGQNTEKNALAYFVFEPKDIVIMKDPSIEPVRLALKDGDEVRVIYINKDGKKQAQSITYYMPKVTKTTVTTTTTTTE